MVQMMICSNTDHNGQLAHFSIVGLIYLKADSLSVDLIKIRKYIIAFKSGLPIFKVHVNAFEKDVNESDIYLFYYPIIIFMS